MTKDLKLQEKNPFEIIKIWYDSNANKSLKKINSIAKLQSVFFFYFFFTVISIDQLHRYVKFSCYWSNNAETFVFVCVCV